MATYYGTDSNDYLDYSTETENLTIDGGSGDDILRGGEGKDTLIGGLGNDTLTGGGGKDTFVVNLYDAHDVITDADANDVLQLGPGITAGHLSADLNGDDLVLTIIGSWQAPWRSVTLQDWQKRPNDRLAAVTLDGNQGKVSLTALVNHEEGQWQSGAGRLEGTSGHDTLDGDSSNNTIYGYGSDDTLRGYDGNDKLYGGAGSDALGGGEGDDTLYPGPGYDMIKGGGGDDVYVFNLGDGQDYIYSWTPDARGLNCCPGWDSSADYGGTDTISFGKGISLNNLRLTYSGDGGGDSGLGSLRLEVGDKGDWICWEGPQPYAINSTNLLRHKVSFTKGPTLTMEELLAKKPVYFNGTTGNDKLQGIGYNEVLIGGKGNDSLYGGAGKDTFFFDPGDGHDVIEDATSDDTIKLGEGITPTRLAVSPTTGLSAKLNGDDLVVGIGKNQSITLQGWNTQADRLLYLTLSYGNNMKISLQDLLNGISTQPSGEVWYADPPGKQGITKTTSKSLSGTKNNDILKGSGKKALVLNGAGGHDRLTGSAGNDKLNGGTGNDWVNGGKGNDTLKGGTGNDWLIGGAGNDSLLGESGNDTLLGGDGKDILKGGAGKDWLSGEVGDDNLYGDAGNDTLSGGAGKDKLYGGAGDDWLYGDAGNDRLSGSEGNDYLFGGDGADKVYGEKGNDTLSGGAGKDTLSGGAGKDRFLFDTALNKKSNVDSITDFRHGEDKIQLKQSIFAKLNTGTLSKANFKASAKGVAGDSNDYILYNTKTGALLYDADGSGKGAAIQFATLSNKPKNVTASDFIVVS